MALNLWKIGGMATSFNPLPLGFVNKVPVLIKPYTLRFKAKSPTSAVLKIVSDATVYQYITLSTDYKDYSFDINSLKQENFFLKDETNAGNIIIDSIELVQKPLPKLTINGIDGFKSGKWTLHANAVVVDDETLTITPTGDFQGESIVIPLLPNTTYTYSAQGLSNGFYTAINGTGVSAFANGSNNGVVTFTTPSGATPNNVTFSTYNGAGSRGTYTFKRPMLNLGSIPAPYEKKRGDKMVMPVFKNNIVPSNVGSWSNSGTSIIYTPTYVKVKPNTQYTLMVNSGYMIGVNARKADGTNPVWFGYYTQKTTITTGADVGNFEIFVQKGGILPTDIINSGATIEEGSSLTYAVQVNPKPKKWVPKKNLFDGQLELGDISVTTGGLGSSSVRLRGVNAIKVKPSTNYVVSNNLGYTMLTFQYDASMNFISANQDTTTLTTASNCAFIRFRFSNNQIDTSVKFQIEEGTTATPFEPYQLVTPRAKTGLSFNGQMDYFQIPSMTMDSIEIECLIDGFQATKYFVDARNGLTNGYFWSNSTSDVYGSGWTSVTVNGSPYGSNIPKNQRIKIKLTAANVFTDDVNILSAQAGSYPTKGTLYKVTCYLNNAIVAQYDFENNRAMAGNTVVPVVTGKSKNLAPSFQNWTNKNSNAVQISDYSYSIPVGSAISYTALNVIPNTTYVLSLGSNSVNAKIGVFTSDGLTSISNYTTSQISFNSGSNSAVRLYIREVDNTKSVYAENWQLEEGTTATTFSPYQWQTATNPLNLIPSFEDARWTIHANAKVLGRDVVHLDATANWQSSFCYLQVLPNTSYKVVFPSNVSFFSVDGYTNPNKTGASTVYTSVTNGNTATFTTNSTTTYINFGLSNGTVTGGFDFIRPQLMQLSGKEGVLNGSPTQLNKHAKRRLYAKR